MTLKLSHQLFFFIVLYCVNLSPKVLIMTIAYNRPDFIIMQAKTCKKFIEDDYEFVIFNNAHHQEMRSIIQQTCEKEGLPCINVPIRTFNGASAHHTEGLQFALETFAFSWPDIVLIVDSDMVPVKKFNVEKYLENYDIAGLHQQRGPINYIWPGLVIINMKTVPNKQHINFMNGTIDGHPGVDSGGHMYYYLKNNPSVKIKYINNCYLNDNNPTQYDPCVNICSQCRKHNKFYCTHNRGLLKSIGFNENDIRFIQKRVYRIEFLISNSFFHYRGGSNYDNRGASYHRYKTSLVQEYVNLILK